MPLRLRKTLRSDYQSLEQLYRADGATTNGGTFDRHEVRILRRSTMISIAILLLVASAAAWGAMYFYGSLGPSQDDGITLTVNAPESIAVGTPLTYGLTVRNDSAQPIRDLYLRVNYPNGFVWRSATVSPESAANNTWSVSALAPGEERVISVEGTVFGEPGSLATIFAVLTYRLPNFSTALQLSDSRSTVLTSGSVAVVWEGPPQAVAGSEATYIVRYQNKGDEPLPPLTLAVTIPEHFVVSSTEPAAPAAQEWRWQTSDLPPGGEGTVRLIGRWADALTGEFVFSAALEGDTGSGNGGTISSGELRVTSAGGDVSLSLLANGAASPAAVSLGDSVRYTLRYENLTDATLEDVEIRVRYDGAIISWAAAELDGGTLDGTTVTWSGKATPALVRIVPRGRGELTWSVPLVARATAATLSVTATPTLAFGKLDGQVVQRSQDGPPVTVAVNTDGNLRVSARYFSSNGAAVGRGPLPPKVGEATTYQVVWTISGTVHPLKDIVVIGALPPNVRAGTGSGSVGTWSVDDTGNPTWLIPALAPGLEPQATFFVTLTPAATDAGKILVLTGQTSLTAVDDTTGGRVTLIGSVATTNLDDDAIAAGRGLVQE